MKLIIQIPCFNEEQTLPSTLRDLPRSIEGVDIIEILIIDDGSTDRTADVARSCGVHHIVKLSAHSGLAAAFASGLDNAVRLGADVIVNTDADNQYKGSDIPELIAPILSGAADIVVGSRDIGSIGHFSPLKKILQRTGSWVVRQISHTHVPDATSGFRAYNREAALRLNIFSDFSYTLETLIQAGIGNLIVAHVPAGTNPKLRESRLFASVPEYLTKSFIAIIRIYTMYNPLKVFSVIAAVFLGVGLILVARFFYYYIILASLQTGHVQSLIVASILLIIGFQIFLFGLLADLTAKNRQLLESILMRLKKGGE